GCSGRRNDGGRAAGAPYGRFRSPQAVFSRVSSCQEGPRARGGGAPGRDVPPRPVARGRRAHRASHGAARGADERLPLCRRCSEAFDVELGPAVANFVLADEINRAPAKVQSAMLEVMAERHVSIGGQTYPMPDPFLVLATQNPIENEGVYPLPEAQRDRFL